MNRQCTRCYSYAINKHAHGREPSKDLDLCDVCYWRKRASPSPDAVREACAKVVESLKVSGGAAYGANMEAVNAIRALDLGAIEG